MKLADRYSVNDLQELLVTPGTWRPFPAIDNRTAWASIDEEQRRSIVSRGDELLGSSWPELRATLFMEYERNGNRSRYQNESYQRRKMLIDLVAAECVEDAGKFIDDIINGVWAICEESFWDVPAHNRLYRADLEGQRASLPDVTTPVVALFSAETGSVIAFALYLVGQRLDAAEPMVRDRIVHELRTRLLDPFMEHDYWFWLGFEDVEGAMKPPNNWNPWIISNLLSMFMLIEEDETRRAQAVHRCVRGLDEFLAGYHSDGGCDEGVSYWGRAGASLYECLDVLHTASDGAIRFWDIPLIQEIGNFVYRIHVGDNWYVNFADGTARTTPYPNVVYHYGERIGNSTLMEHGIASHRHRLNERVEFQSFNRYLDDLFRPVPADPEVDFPYIGQHWFDGIEVLSAREEEGSSNGLFLAAKGGHNHESHNHNDVGNFVVGLNGVPVIIDVGVGEYTSKTFSPRRYEIWTMQSAYHNLPLINDHQQPGGSEYRAIDVSAELTPERASIALEIGTAWGDESGIESWRRTCALDRAASAITITDKWELANAPESIVFVLMAHGEIDSSTPGEVQIHGDGGTLSITFDGDRLALSTEWIDIDDTRMSPVWGAGLTRILLSVRQPEIRGELAMQFREAAPNSVHHGQHSVAPPDHI